MKLNVNFSSVGFGKLFQKPENVSDAVPDKEVILQVSSFLPQTVVSRSPPVEFKSIAELLGFEYVGYIIEKERFDTKNQEWIKTDEYKLIGSKSNVFRDTRVAYGFTYRYRMKSVLKVTIKRDVKNLSNFSATKDLQKFVDSKIQSKLVQNNDLMIQVQKEGNDGISLKTSAGVKESSVKISDTVQAVLTPENTFKLVGSVNDKDLDLAKGSMSDEQFLKSINEQIDRQAKIEKDVEYVSFYYESNAAKEWTTVDVVKLVPPSYPQTIKIFPNSLKKEIIISWLKPVSDVEVRFYSIYRRTQIGEAWTPIAEGLREFETLFIDTAVAVGQKYIYAISCIDVHGIESFLSTQIQVQLNPNIATDRKEKDLVWISGGGVGLSEIELIIKKFYERKEHLVATKNITLRPSTKFREESKVFLIKIKSLDTHERVELKCTLKNQKLEI